MTRALFIAGVTCIFSGCMTPHLPSTHFTPLFTQRGQVDAEASVGLSSYNLNAGYSPVKHLALLGNVQSFPSNTQRSAEGAIGFYHQTGNVYFGLNSGYGQGIYSESYSISNTETVYREKINGNFNKWMNQFYISCLDDPANPQIQVGLSFRYNLYWDNYAHTLEDSVPNIQYFKPASFVPQALDKKEQIQSRNSNWELCLFTRCYISHHLYCSFQAGYRSADLGYNFEAIPRRYTFRLGLGFNISTLGKSKKA
jgi:hypothetical protein